jgi:hypothetical protein
MVLNKRLLALQVLDYQHDAKIIFRFVLSVIEEFQRRDKICAIGFYNATSCNIAMCFLTNILKPIIKWYMISLKMCMSILNLIVKASMEADPIQVLIEKVQGCFKICRSEHSKKIRFCRIVVQEYGR